jgi:cation diffusion facilitator CzcD-associated flavoprotein CzcO
MSQVQLGQPAARSPVADFDAVVVGAGFAGMYMLHRLRRLGFSTRVFETGDSVGGTWYWNRYPGARVDVPSLSYSYSFSPELQQDWCWPETYSSQEELLKYANHVADRFDLRRDIQFETTVNRATYDDQARWWVVRTDRGDRVTARFLITAAGCLSATNIPNFPGLDTFQGEWYHTSRWPRQGVRLAGRTVGVIGTGSTGIQAVPVIAEEASHLYVFQRTPNYSLPTGNQPMDPCDEQDWKARYEEHRDRDRNSYAGRYVLPPQHAVLDIAPEDRDRIFEEAWREGAFAMMQAFKDLRTSREANDIAAEFVRRKIRQLVRDPEVAELLCPKDYPIGTKRLCLDVNYYQTFNRSNVTLVDVKTHPIREITPTGLRTSNRAYDMDVLVFATGFDAMTGPLLRMNITGAGGLALKQKWEHGPRTYLGLAAAGFPNLFMITGPGSPSVLASMITAIEQHVDLIGGTITHMSETGSTEIAATSEAEDRWVQHVNEVADATLYKHANSWYLGANIPGKPRVFMPYVGGFNTYAEKCKQMVTNDYDGFVLR